LIRILVFLLNSFRQLVFVLDIDPKPSVKAHPQIRKPRQNEECDDVSAPVVDQQLKLGKKENAYRDPVAKAVFTGKDVEELPLQQPAAGSASFLASIAPLSKHLLLCDRPGNTSNDRRQNHQPVDLFDDAHLKKKAAAGTTKDAVHRRV
jgi:hypothetical protein